MTEINLTDAIIELMNEPAYNHPNEAIWKLACQYNIVSEPMESCNRTTKAAIALRAFNRELTTEAALEFAKTSEAADGVGLSLFILQNGLDF